MKTRLLAFGLVLIALIIFFKPTDKDKVEWGLNSDTVEFISSIGLIDKGEEIEMFDCFAGFNGYKQSGNMITNFRLATYWINEDSKVINSAYYSNIESLIEVDQISTQKYASYLEVHKADGTNFNLYVLGDSTRTYEFFKKAKENWRQSKKPIIE